MPGTVHLSVVIPCFNEANRLPATLSAVLAYLAEQSYSSEVLIVDDGSSDATVRIARDMVGQAGRVIANTVNKGKGAVVRQGMLEAVGEYRLFMDADGSTSISELGPMLLEAGNHDVVIGSRRLIGSNITVQPPILRRIISRGSNMLIQLLALPGIRDTQCGFKLFTAQATEAIFRRDLQPGWLFDVEVLVVAREQGLRIAEVPVVWADSRASSLRAGRAVTTSLTELLRIARKRRQGLYK